MISSKEIKDLADGKNPDQVLHIAVKAPDNIIPIIVLNVFINLGCVYVYSETAIEKNSQLVGGKPLISKWYFFTVSQETYKKLWGEYKPNKIIPFTISGV
jgi:hypothetical protein